MSARRRPTITQKEARSLRARVAELEGILQDQRRHWRADWPQGVNIATVAGASDQEPALVAVRTARRLGHAVVVVDNGPRLALLALPLEGGAL